MEVDTETGGIWAPQAELMSCEHPIVTLCTAAAGVAPYGVEVGPAKTGKTQNGMALCPRP